NRPRGSRQGAFHPRTRRARTTAEGRSTFRGGLGPDPADPNLPGDRSGGLRCPAPPTEAPRDSRPASLARSRDTRDPCARRGGRPPTCVARERVVPDGFRDAVEAPGTRPGTRDLGTGIRGPPGRVPGGRGRKVRYVFRRLAPSTPA